MAGELTCNGIEFSKANCWIVFISINSNVFEEDLDN